MQNHIVRRTVVSCLAVLFSLCLQLHLQTRALSQQAPPSDLDKQQIVLSLKESPFAGVIEALSQQIGRSILVDGTPLLTQADFNLHTSSRAALDAVADKFDYNWTIGKRGTILFRKRFKDRNAIPQMHFLEIKKMTADIAALLPEYNHSRGDIFPVNALVRLLSPEQVQALQSGQRLSYAQLNQEQQALLHFAISNNMVTHAKAIWQRAALEIAALPFGHLEWRHWRHPIISKRDTAVDGDLPDPYQTGQTVRDENGNLAKGYVMRDAEGDELRWIWRDNQGKEQSRVMAETPTFILKKEPVREKK